MSVHSNAGGSRWGSKKGPVVVLTYAACGSAAEQFSGHLSAVGIAGRVAADMVVLPHTRAASPAGGLMEIATEAVFDVGVLQTHLARMGVQARTCPFKPRERLSEGASYLPDAATTLGFPKETSVMKVRPGRRTLDEWARTINTGLLDFWRRQTVIVDLGCVRPFAVSRVHEGDRLQLLAAHDALQFTEGLVQAARNAMEAVRKLTDTAQYDAVVLPPTREGGTDALFSAQLRSQPFRRPAYVTGGDVSGLPPHGSTLLRQCGNKHGVLEWIELHVLIEGERFLGFEGSALSQLVLEERTLRGRGLSSSTLISDVGAAPRAFVPRCCDTDMCLTVQCTAADA
eukprot:TRINITY_DN15851_c1_g1_i1.p1 TRINITY_DN15851_c1_g1~~TRINITY_DN15851_c1_g1_i1.p1  ORF type:complete len:342 (+),score=36.21 TRINITY_DN15851_c1_g1_i1:459-1484(+)